MPPNPEHTTTSDPAQNQRVRRASVRPLAEADIPQIADLHHELMSPRARAPVSFFKDLYLNSPWSDVAIPSLVYETREGDVAGFLGVFPRPMVIGKEAVTAACASKFMVRKDARSSMAALKLFRRFLDGPQHLAFADVANEQGLDVWQAFGGRVVPVYSTVWHRRLRWRPSQRLRRGLGGLAGKIARVGYSVVDGTAGLALPSLRPAESGLVRRAFDPTAVAAALEKMVGPRVLRPDYDEASLSWVVHQFSSDPENQLESACLVNDDGDLVGWFMYQIEPSRVAQVLQIVAKPQETQRVLDDLLHDAWGKGATRVSGRVEPLLLPALSKRRDISARLRPYTMVVQAKDPEIREAVFQGDALMTALEGEALTQFYGERSA